MSIYNNKNIKSMIPKETYTQKKYIGSGTFGNVYLIQSNKTNREYVRKQIYLSSLSKDEEKSALREVSISKKFNHPNIILFKEAFITRYPERSLHLITEYADNGDLEKKLKEQKEKKEFFKENIIINWLIQICLALKYIHKLKVIHRDIKPSNIFLTKSDIIKIGDFGISIALTRTLNKAKSVIGTPLYMAPEVYDSANYDYKADIWSLGITFFQLITFNDPFKGNSPVGLYKNIIEGKKNMSINANNKYYSQELIDIIQKMMTKNPKERPSIDEIFQVPIIKQNLEEFLENNKELYKDVEIEINNEIYQSLNESNNNNFLPTINEDEDEEKDVSRILEQKTVLETKVIE